MWEEYCYPNKGDYNTDHASQPQGSRGQASQGVNEQVTVSQVHVYAENEKLKADIEYLRTENELLKTENNSLKEQNNSLQEQLKELQS